MTNLENLGARAEPEELEIARAVVHDYLGEVTVVEESGGVFGYPRVTLVSGYKSGAQGKDLNLHGISTTGT